MARSALNYGIIAVGFALRDGQYVERCGSSSVRHFDQRWGLARMADEAKAWAEREGHDAWQLQRAHDGYRSARPISELHKLN